MSDRPVAIIGAGYSGTVLAIELLERGATVALIERAPVPARGVAYATGAAEHLLNVRASGMSALAGEPNDFVEWLADRGDSPPEGFAPRRTYGRYLGDLLQSARERHGPRLQLLHDEAIALEPGGVRLRSGEILEAAAVVLALGNLRPETIRQVPADLPPGVYFADPWSPGLTHDLGADHTVLLVGTGLTAVDAVLSLDAAGFEGRILALSRRGLLPRAHADRPIAAPDPPADLTPRASALVARVRRAAKGEDWRPAIDSLRPVTQHLWARASLDERRRFLRHLRPWWDVHRHRIAPAVAGRLAGLQRQGRLTVAAGRLLTVSGSHAEAQVRWRERGRTEVIATKARRIVNCTGPRMNIAGAGEPLLDSLLGAGRIRPDPCRIGIDIDPDSRVRDQCGAPDPRLYGIGPMTRGALWEIVAVPDIRVQAQRLADLIIRSAAVSQMARSGAFG